MFRISVLRGDARFRNVDRITGVTYFASKLSEDETHEKGLFDGGFCSSDGDAGGGAVADRAHRERVDPIDMSPQLESAHQRTRARKA